MSSNYENHAVYTLHVTDLYSMTVNILIYSLPVTLSYKPHNRN